MRWVLLLVLLIPSATACSLASSPVGPGYLEAVSYDLETTHTIPVPDRGLGADCGLELPMALHNETMAWWQDDRIRWMHLPTGEMRDAPWPQRPTGLAIDEDGILVFQRLGRYPNVTIEIYALHEDGSADLLRTGDASSLPSPYQAWPGSSYNQTTHTYRRMDLRTGELAFEIDAAPHETYPADDIHIDGSDGRFLVASVHGQGRSVTIVWDDATATWSEPAVDWFWSTGIVDGVMHGVRDGRVFHVDLASGETTTTDAPRYDVLAFSNEWMMTGTYATEYRDFPMLPFPAPAPVWLLLGLLVLALGRRRT